MKIKTPSALILLGLVIGALSVTADDKWDISKVDLSKLPPAADQKAVTYAKDIQPLFAASCVGCHGKEKAKGDLRLDSLEAVLKGGEAGKMVIPSDSKQSLLLVAAAQIDNETAMPPKRGPGGPGGPGGRPSGPGGGNPPPFGGPGGPGGPGGAGRPGGGGFGPPPKPLTPAQVGLIRAWIDQGAK